MPLAAEQVGRGLVVIGVLPLRLLGGAIVVALELFALEGVAAFVAGADLEDVLPRALSFAAPVSVPLKRFFCGRSGSTLA